MKEMESESIKRELKDLDHKNEQLEIKLESKNSDAQRLQHELLTLKTKYEKDKQHWQSRFKKEEIKFEALEQSYKELEKSIVSIVQENQQLTKQVELSEINASEFGQTSDEKEIESLENTLNKNDL